MLSLGILQAVVLFGAAQIMPDHVSIAAPAVSMARIDGCPTFQIPAECPDDTEDFCTDDSVCPVGLKCCNIGCEKDCVPPVQEATAGPDQVSTAALNISTAGTDGCPTFQIPAECPDDTEDFCTDDSVCPVGLKCCNIGCEKDCVTPVQEATAEPVQESTTECGVSSPDQYVDWTPSVVNVTFGQYESTSYWYVNVSWTPLNDSYGDWTDILVKLLVLTSTNEPIFGREVTCSVHPKNLTFLNINISSHHYEYPSPILLKVVAFPYSPKEDVTYIKDYYPPASTQSTTGVFPTTTPRKPRTGGCPTFQIPAECPDFTEDFCTDDSVCPVGLVCCNIGCEKDCVTPVQEPTAVPDQVSTAAPNISIAGTDGCPTFQIPAQCPDVTEDFCTDDSDCLEGLKCCNTGCEKDCFTPVQEPTAAPDEISTAASETTPMNVEALK